MQQSNASTSNHATWHTHSQDTTATYPSGKLVNYKRLACYEHCPGTFGYTFVLNCNTLHFWDRFGPHFQACSVSTTVITWWLWKKMGTKHIPKTQCIIFQYVWWKIMWVPMSYAVIRNLKNSAYDKELLYNRRAIDFQSAAHMI